MLSKLDLDPKCQSHSRNQKLTRAVLVFATECKNNVDPRLRCQKKVNYVQLFFCQVLVTGVHLMCQIFMNDLLTEQGQQRSRVIR